VVILIHQLKYPLDFEGWSKADQDEFRSWRKELSEVLKDAAVVLTGEFLYCTQLHLLFHGANVCSNKAMSVFVLFTAT